MCFVDASEMAREHLRVKMFRSKVVSAGGADDMMLLFTISNPSLTSLMEVGD
jgi:hypothetical protein